MPADWDCTKPGWRAAGPQRNAAMLRGLLELPNPLWLAAPGGTGTKHMVGLLVAAHVPGAHLKDIEVLLADLRADKEIVAPALS
jgi:hypothetical protein